MLRSKSAFSLYTSPTNVLPTTVRAKQGKLSKIKLSLLLVLVIVFLLTIFRMKYFSKTKLKITPLVSKGRESFFLHAPHYQELKNATKYTVAMVSDMDERNKIKWKNKKAWLSIFKIVELERQKDGTYSLEFIDEKPLVNHLSSSGRGMELSELVYFHNKLLACSDRTGVVYEIRNGKKLIPLWILADGDGNSEDGYKAEWMTVKDDVLYVGSSGKEYEENGVVRHRNRQWIKKITLNGVIEHEDWVEVYERMKNVTQSAFIVHEAVNFNPIDRRWNFLPRKMGREAWTFESNDMVGSFKLISCNEWFEDWEVKEIGRYHVGHGFSSFKFIPFREDKEIIGLKTIESKDDVHSELVVANIQTGAILLHKKMDHIKFEGLEIIN